MNSHIPGAVTRHVVFDCPGAGRAFALVLRAT